MDKVVWSEGMFLRPQHFQQHDRYLEDQIVSRYRHFTPFFWGFSRLDLDLSLLALGKLAVASSEGIFPDGTLFRVNYDPVSPLVVQLHQAQQGQRVFLAIPPQVKGAVDSDDDGESRGIRYRLSQSDIRDSHGISNERTYPITIGSLNVKLVTEDQLDGQVVALPVARVSEVNGEGAVVLDRSFGVPALDIGVNGACLAKLSDLAELMQSKAQLLAANIESGKGNGAGTLVDLLMLKALNAWGAQLGINIRQTPLHPFELFKNLASLVAEISTYSRVERLPDIDYEYRHLESAEMLTHLIETASVLVSIAFKSAAISLPVQRKKFGISVVGLPSQAMVDESEFILAIKADISADNIRKLASNKIKAGSIENIKDLVNLQLPGCMKELLPVTPRQIPYHAGMHYFRLLPDPEMKASIRRSNGVGLHVSGEVSRRGAGVLGYSISQIPIIRPRQAKGGERINFEQKSREGNDGGYQTYHGY